MAEAPERGELTQAQTIAALQAALEAERVRSREIDHRAKNSLQLVASLLLLLSKRSKEPETQRTLKTMHQRLGAVAAVHRDILTAERPECFDLTQFVRDHVTTLLEGHGEGAAVRLALDPVAVRAAHACPLALIVNELTLNALTHGAAGKAGAQVSLDLQAEDGGFKLTVQDDGPGRPEDAPAGFGLTMVKLLAQQVGASFALEPAQPGVRAVVTAP